MVKKYSLKNGEVRYMYHTYLGIDPVTNKKVYKKKQEFKTKKEAELAEARLKYEIIKNGFPSEKNTRSFNEVYDLWMESEYMDNVQESTLQKTQRNFINHIIPSFDGMMIDEIKPSYCQSELNKWRDKLIGFKKIKNYSKKVFDYAVRMDMIDSNLFDKVTTPKRVKAVQEEQTENFYTKDELNKFLSCVEKDLTLLWYAYFRIIAYSGARKSEILALRWDDIDFKDSTINISKTLTHGLNNKQIEQPTKTISGLCTVDMDKDSMIILKRWKSFQAEFKFSLGINTSATNQLVFSTNDNTPFNLNTPNDRMRKVQIKNQLKGITVHGLRHTHCSLLFSAGASIKEVQERLGHSDIQTTMNIYAHVTKEDKKDTADKFANFMGN